MTTSVNLFQWLPRFLSILAIICITLFAADAFNSDLSFWRKLGLFFLHLIPSVILLLMLMVAWKREFLGGILFIIIGSIGAPLLMIFNFNINRSVIKSLGITLALTIPFIVVGILFLVSHNRKKKNPA